MQLTTVNKTIYKFSLENIMKRLDSAKVYFQLEIKTKFIILLKHNLKRKIV